MSLVSLASIFGAGGVGASKVTDTVRNLAAHFLPKVVFPKWVWNGVTFAATIGVAFWSNLQAVAGLHGGWGHLVTGVGVGGAGSFFHELQDMLSSAAKRMRPAA